MVVRRRIQRRQPQLESAESETLIDRLYRIRGVADPAELDYALSGLITPATMKGLDQGASLLAHAVQTDQAIMIVGDFDADGATSCALMVLVLREMGASRVDYLVPDRFRFGYGLTPEIVDVAAQRSPDLIITVDNGIASVDGVARANQLGIQVLVTDHHLPGAILPAAAAIVNPNQPDCQFPSKHLAGVGVAFYLLSAVRAKLRSDGFFGDQAGPNLAGLLDLVALGTVADVVPLDQNNRRLVHEGLRRMRARRLRPGLQALCEIAGLNPEHLTSRDLAFSLAPRLNAAGRLEDMTIGIECLLADADEAPMLAERLDNLNRERQELESTMREEAMINVDELALEGETGGICLYSLDWHQGIVGIIASRVRERTHRPVIAFAQAGDQELKGSGRSVPGFHLRDALDTIATSQPGLITRFGGHAMAAGLSLQPDRLDAFREAFDAYVKTTLGEAPMEQVVDSDGELGEPVSLAVARQLEAAGPWGQGFPEPAFDDRFEIVEQRIVGGRHVKMRLQPETGQPVDAIYFNQPSLIENRFVRCAYRIEINRFRGRETPQLIVNAIVDV